MDWINKTGETFIQNELNNLSTVLHSEGWNLGIVQICWNNKFKTKAGRVSLKTKVIELNPKYLQEFGEKRLLETLRHEVAHLIADVFYGEIGHDRTFKRICSHLGGTMNYELASNDAPETASYEYIHTPDKYELTCPECGASHRRKKKPSMHMIKNAYCNFCGMSLRKFHLEKL